MSELATKLTKCNLISFDILTTQFDVVYEVHKHHKLSWKVFEYNYFRGINVLYVIYLVYDKTTLDKVQVECNAK